MVSKLIFAVIWNNRQYAVKEPADHVRWSKRMPQDPYWIFRVQLSFQLLSFQVSGLGEYFFFCFFSFGYIMYGSYQVCAFTVSIKNRSNTHNAGKCTVGIIRCFFPTDRLILFQWPPCNFPEPMKGKVPGSLR